MKISIEKDVIEFIPETQEETNSLETLWRILVDCATYNKKIVPIGEFIPSIGKNVAKFYIESQSPKESATTTTPKDETVEEIDLHCAFCNKYLRVKKGSKIPLCCGIPMEIID